MTSTMYVHLSECQQRQKQAFSPSSLSILICATSQPTSLRNFHDASTFKSAANRFSANSRRMLCAHTSSRSLQSHDAVLFGTVVKLKPDSTELVLETFSISQLTKHSLLSAELRWVDCALKSSYLRWASVELLDHLITHGALLRGGVSLASKFRKLFWAILCISITVVWLCAYRQFVALLLDRDEIAAERLLVLHPLSSCTQPAQCRLHFPHQLAASLNTSAMNAIHCPTNATKSSH